jgi:hypothetical protein
MIKAPAANGWLDERDAVRRVLLSIGVPAPAQSSVIFSVGGALAEGQWSPLLTVMGSWAIGLAQPVAGHSPAVRIADQPEYQYELLQVAPEKLDSAVTQFKRTGSEDSTLLCRLRPVLRLADQLSERALPVPSTR